MLFSNNRQELRQLFFATWQAHQTKSSINALQKQILAVILIHPEYHTLLSQQDKYIDKDYLPENGETNPFLHMSFHLSLREQCSTNRPKGIKKLYKKYCQQFLGDEHDAEHAMIDVLAELMWEMQAKQLPYSDQLYLEKLKNKLRNPAHC